jgi:hypothetical protein
MNLWKHLSLIAATAVMLLAGASAYADKPLLVQSCTRSTLCGATVVQFEEASDYPRRPLFLEPEGSSVSPIGSGSQKQGQNAVQFSGSNFLWAPGGGAFGQYFTVAVWVYPTVLGSSNQIQYLLSEDGDNIPGNALYLQNLSGLLKAVIDIRDGVDPRNGAHVTATWSADISRNAWHLIIARLRPQYVKQGATNGVAAGELSIIVDNGTPVTTSVTVPLNTGGGRLFAGKTNQKGSEQYFTGYMDELAIAGDRWNDTQTAFYWNNGGGLSYPFVTANPSYTSTHATWRLDKVNPDLVTLPDDSGAGCDLTPVGTITVNSTNPPPAGLPQFSASFGGTQYATTAFAGCQGQNLGSQAFSVDGWVRFSGVASAQTIFTHGSYVVKLSATGSLQITNGTVTATDSSALSANTWYYFVARFDGSTFKIAHNGASGGSVAGSAVSTTGNYQLGSPASGINGRLAMVSAYHSALSDAEVALHYASGSGVACCPFK